MFIFFQRKLWIIRYGSQEMLIDQLLQKGHSVLAVFFDINGHVVQASVPRGRPVAGTFYQRRILEQLYKYLYNVDQRQC